MAISYKAWNFPVENHSWEYKWHEGVQYQISFSLNKYVAHLYWEMFYIVDNDKYTQLCIYKHMILNVGWCFAIVCSFKTDPTDPTLI